jgi:protein gp37
MNKSLGIYMEKINWEAIQMEFSNINFTDHTWNPYIGCRPVSDECDHCYADTLVTNRMGRDFSIVTRTKTWKAPQEFNRKAPALALKLGRRVRVFCASLSDFFIQDADEWRAEAWEVIRQCPYMGWLILTKRPQLIPSRLPADWGKGWPHVWQRLRSHQPKLPLRTARILVGDRKCRNR